MGNALACNRDKKMGEIVQFVHPAVATICNDYARVQPVLADQWQDLQDATRRLGVPQHSYGTRRYAWPEHRSTILRPDGSSATYLLKSVEGLLTFSDQRQADEANVAITRLNMGDAISGARLSAEKRGRLLDMVAGATVRYFFAVEPEGLEICSLFDAPQPFPSSVTRPELLLSVDDVAARVAHRTPDVALRDYRRDLGLKLASFAQVTELLLAAKPVGDR